MTVRVALFVLDPGPEQPTRRQIATVELSRVPHAGEYVRHCSEHYCVRGVVHVVGGEVVAELQIERLPSIHSRPCEK